MLSVLYLQCIPFWPISCPSKNLAVRIGDSTEVSPRFAFEPDVTVLLKMNNKVRDIGVIIIQ